MEFILCMIFWFTIWYIVDNASGKKNSRQTIQIPKDLDLTAREKKRIKNVVEQHVNIYYPNVQFYTDTIVRFYVKIYNELSPKRKREYNLFLNTDVMSSCIAIVKERYYLSVTSEEEACLARIPEDIQALLKKNRTQIRELTDVEDRLFYNYDKKRCMRVYQEYIHNFDPNDPELFYSKISKLASLNKDVRIVDTRSVYYKSHNFIAPYHKEISLKLYLHYLSVKSHTQTFKYREMTKKNAKLIFRNEDEKARFDLISEQLKKDFNLEKALEKLPEVFTPPRRKINLDIEKIRSEKDKQDSVVRLLGEYLSDEEPVIELQPEINHVDLTDTAGNNQKELIALFIDKGYCLNDNEIDIFVESRGLFKGQFIQSINEYYYEELDDLLIEEDGDNYILNRDYYQQIVK